MDKGIIRVAVDAMGGDARSFSVVLGLDLLCVKLLHLGFYDFVFNIFGDYDEIHPVVRGLKLNDFSHIIHTDSVIYSDDKPSMMLRKGKDSSMYRALLSLKNGESDCVVSSGNTGALMAISKMLLGMLPDIHRPAIVAALPNDTGDFVMLDLGANLDVNSETLLQFGIMGSAFSQVVLKKDRPKVALLNIGTEEQKGTDTIRKALHLFRENEDKINFFGYIEPDVMLNGEVDVVVTDGFSGNLVLKMAEGMMSLVSRSIKDSLSNSFISKVLEITTVSNINKSLKRFDPKLRNGAMLLGLNGVVIKAHGSSDKYSFMNAVSSAMDAVKNGINDQIISNIELINGV